MSPTQVQNEAAPGVYLAFSRTAPVQVALTFYLKQNRTIRR